jgi:hypothetical protein
MEFRDNASTKRGSAWEGASATRTMPKWSGGLDRPDRVLLVERHVESMECST